MLKQFFLQALTDQQSLIGALKLAHWNVVGEEFYSHHLLFEKLYELLSSKVDGLAEQARGCDVEVIALIFSFVPDIEWETAEDLCRELIKLNEEFVASLKNLRREADSEAEFGVVNVVEDILSDCNTVKYLLTSSLKNPLE